MRKTSFGFISRLMEREAYYWFPPRPAHLEMLSGLRRIAQVATEAGDTPTLGREVRAAADWRAGAR